MHTSTDSSNLLGNETDQNDGANNLFMRIYKGKITKKR